MAAGRIVISPMASCGSGHAGRALTQEAVAAVCDEALSAWGVAGKRVMVRIPGHTRTCCWCSYSARGLSYHGNEYRGAVGYLAG